MLWVLLEADTTEFVGSNLVNLELGTLRSALPLGSAKNFELYDFISPVGSKPFGGGEDGVGLIVGEEVAYHLRAFCHKETLTTTELLLLQLTDILDLVFTDSHRLHRFYADYY